MSHATQRGAKTAQPASSGLATVAGMGACYALGTFTDNFYKQAAILIAAAAGVSASPGVADEMIGVQGLATILLSLPFVLFSAWGGAVADRVSKKTIVVAAKTLEFLALFMGGYMLVTRNWPGILAVIFLMGTQSTFFSPAINGSIPENFAPNRVPRANALIKLASTTAILAGFALAGLILDIRPGSLPGLPDLPLDGPAYGRAMAAGFVILVALLGLLTAFTLRRIPAASTHGTPFPWSGPVRSWLHVRELRKDKSLMLAILADAWFYGVAAVAVISIANLAARLGYSTSMSGAMMALLMIGVAAGALVGGRYSVDSWRRVIMPVGCAMSCALLLVTLTPLIPAHPSCNLRLFWFGGTLFASGFFGGMYIIPLESFIQVRPAAHEKGKVIAVSNFISFLAMAAFGAAFKFIGLLPPALNFAVYGGATLLFLFLAARRWLIALPEASLRDSAFSLPGFILRCVLALRYSVRETGLDAIAPAKASGQRAGLLILPNHPALVDPILVYSRLAGLAPRPLSDEGQMHGLVQGMVAKLLHVVTIPDLERPGTRDSADATRKGLDRIADALKQGDNVLLYPAGRVYRSSREILGNKSAVSRLLHEVPEARVILVRTRGLWGSSFSYASGKAPRLMRCIARGILAVLANLLFFTPRRTVTMEFAEPADLPRDADKTRLNRYLEAFYNEAETPAVTVPRFFWQPRRAKISRAPSAPATGEGSPVTSHNALDGDVPAEIRERVYAVLREKAGLPENAELSPGQSLADDLHFDSLALMETVLELEEEFGHAIPRPEAIATVGDCLGAAAGILETGEDIPPADVPAAWFSLPPDPDGARSPDPEAATIVDAFFRAARKDPDRPLTGERSGVRTRKAILTGALALSRPFGALPGRRLGIMLPAVPAALPVWLAAMLAGKEPVFINWTVGRRNLEHCLALADVRHVVSATALLDQVRRTGTPIDELPVTWVALETLAGNLSAVAKIRAALAAALHCSFLPFSLKTDRVRETAAILFTSGSETRPKGVPLSHANILCNARDVLKALNVRNSDTILAMLPPFHSFGLMVGLALPAATGIPAAFHPNPTESAHVNAVARDFKPTLTGATPTFLEAMLAKAGRTHDLASLRYAFAGAEKCPEHVYKAFARACPDGALYEGYGITECSPVVAVNRPGNAVAGSIGSLLPSVEGVMVREAEDENGSPLPTARAAYGETAMLLVRGPSVFSGYLAPSGGDAEPAPSPFVRFEGKEWYRTGDLLVMEPDGRLFFKGRRKRFVKLGGEMISLPQMEEVLQQAFAPMVKDTGEGKPFIAVANAAPADDAETVELVAFTTLDLGVRDINQALRAGGLSPLYAVRGVRRLAEIPLLGSGKTDYRALREKG